MAAPRELPHTVDKESQSYWLPSLIVLCVTQFFTMSGMALVVPFLPFYIRELGITDPTAIQQWSGFVIAGPFLTAIIFNPLWGAIGDRVGRKLMIIRALFGLFIVLFLMGLAQAAWHLLLVRMLQGAITGFIAAAMALIATIMPEKRMGWGLAMLTAAQSAGVLVGPFFGGILADTVGYRPLFFLVSVAMLVGIPAVIVFVRETKETKSKPGFLVGFKIVKSSRQIQRLILCLATSRAAFFMTFPILPLFVEKLVTGNVSTWTGAMMGVTGLFSMIATGYWGKLGDRIGIEKIIPWTLTGAGIALGLHAAIGESHHLLIIRAVQGACMGGIFPLIFSKIGLLVKPENRGATLGVANAAFMFGHLVGPIFGGLIAPIVGLRAIFILGGIIVLVAYLPFKSSTKVISNNSRSDVGGDIK